MDRATATPFRTFEDLEVYQVAREFRKAMYAVNRRLPSFEKFELGSQIRRAAVSLTNNIAEGHGRYRYLDQIRFCLHARGSTESPPQTVVRHSASHHTARGPARFLLLGEKDRMRAGRSQTMRVHSPAMNGRMSFWSTLTPALSPRRGRIVRPPSVESPPQDIVSRVLRGQKQGASLALREDSPAYGPAEDDFDELLRQPNA